MPEQPQFTNIRPLGTPRFTNIRPIVPPGFTNVRPINQPGLDSIAAEAGGVTAGAAVSEPPPTDTTVDTSSILGGAADTLIGQAKGVWQEVKQPYNYISPAMVAYRSLVAPQLPLIKRSAGEISDVIKHPLTAPSPLTGLHLAEALALGVGPMASSVEESSAAGRTREAIGKALVYGGQLALPSVTSRAARVGARAVVGGALNVGTGLERSLQAQHSNALALQSMLRPIEEASYRKAGAMAQTVQDTVDTAHPNGLIDAKPLLEGIGEHAKEVVKIPDKYPPSFVALTTRLQQGVPLTFGELKQLRSALGKESFGDIAARKYSGPALNASKNAYGEASNSLKAAADATGVGQQWQDANKAFEQHANDFWRSPVRNILEGENAADIMRPLTGKNRILSQQVLDRYLDPTFIRQAVARHTIMERGQRMGTPSKWEAIFAPVTGGLSLARPAIFRLLQHPSVASRIARSGISQTGRKTPPSEISLPAGPSPVATPSPVAAFGTPEPSIKTPPLSFAERAKQLPPIKLNQPTVTSAPEAIAEPETVPLEEQPSEFEASTKAIDKRRLINQFISYVQGRGTWKPSIEQLKSAREFTGVDISNPENHMKALRVLRKKKLEMMKPAKKAQ